MSDEEGGRSARPDSVYAEGPQCNVWIGLLFELRDRSHFT